MGSDAGAPQQPPGPPPGPGGSDPPAPPGGGGPPAPPGGWGPPVPPSGSGSSDTPGWTNGYHYGCQEYQLMGWCANGQITPQKEWTASPQMNYPSRNCAVCGR